MKMFKIFLSILVAIGLVIFAMPIFFPLNCPPMEVGHNIANLRTISTALKLFKLDVGRFPTEVEGFDILTASNNSREIIGYKKDGYIEGLPTDTWDNTYHYYEYKLESGEPVAVVWTFGADNLPNGEDRNTDIFISVIGSDIKN